MCVILSLSLCLSLISEGQLNISPTNCNSVLNDICVRNIHRGQSVKLCTRTSIPSTPLEGRVTKFIGAHWHRKRSEGNLEDLFECFENGFVKEARLIQSKSLFEDRLLNLLTTITTQMLMHLVSPSVMSRKMKYPH